MCIVKNLSNFHHAWYRYPFNEICNCFHVLFSLICFVCSYIRTQFLYKFYGYSLAICLFFVNQQSQQKSDFKFVMFFDLFGKHFVRNKKDPQFKKLKIFLFPYISYGFMSSKLYNPTSCSICCCASLRH